MPPDEQHYVQRIRELEAEISAAILAISDGSLDALEESLWKQQVLCVTLQRLLESLRAKGVEPDAMVRMRSATVALQKLNATYKQLVQQAQSSADLLYTLCLSYKEVPCRGMDSARLDVYSLEA